MAALQRVLNAESHTVGHSSRKAKSFCRDLAASVPYTSYLLSLIINILGAIKRWYVVRPFFTTLALLPELP